MKHQAIHYLGLDVHQATTAVTRMLLTFVFGRPNGFYTNLR
jgi:hypothetical protein